MDLGHRVMVIEDDEVFSHLISKALFRAGYDTLVVSDGLSALDTVDRYQPDVIFLDLYLPMLDGWEFLQKYREQSPVHKPIIVTSATPVDLASLGDVIEFLPKPFSIKLLLKLLESLFYPTSART